MKYYHATTEKTMEKIFTDGAIRKSWDGCVYLCTTAVDACKFLILRGIKRMIVVEVELDESEVEESHDHNSETEQVNSNSDMCTTYSSAGFRWQQRLSHLRRSPCGWTRHLRA